jgi:hypothetical protein
LKKKSKEGRSDSDRKSGKRKVRRSEEKKGRKRNSFRSIIKSSGGVV